MIGIQTEKSIEKSVEMQPLRGFQYPHNLNSDHERTIAVMSILEVPSYEVTAPSGPKPLTFWRIALAVFVGNILTGVLVGIVIAFVKG